MASARGKSKPKREASLSKPKFYIGIQEKDAKIIAYSYASLTSDLFDKETSRAESKSVTERPKNENFREVFLSFKETMDLYRTFIPLTLSFAPIFSTVMGPNKIRDFAIKKGLKRDDVSTDEKSVYELDLECFREFSIHRDEAASALRGAHHLPEVMVIGLISCYDAFLSRLLNVAINVHQEIVLTSEKTIKYSELTEYTSIENVRQAIIAKEIEAVIRESHQEHFSWMERKFSVPLRKDLPIWPSFIEICERRNLLTHTGGIVSEHYITIGKSQKFDIKGLVLGQKLGVDSQYFSKAVDIIYEIGIKLTYVFWRKLLKAESREADQLLNELCYDLIFREAYSLAEVLLSFATTIPARGMDQRIRLMLLINYANAARLQGKMDQAKAILNREDWSACAPLFQLSVAAVREDVGAVIKLMKSIGKDGSPNAEDYRLWPVFRGLTDNVQFKEAFENIFGIPLIRPTTSKVPLGSKPTPKKVIAKVPPTRH